MKGQALIMTVNDIHVDEKRKLLVLADELQAFETAIVFFSDDVYIQNSPEYENRRNK